MALFFFTFYFIRIKYKNYNCHLWLQILFYFSYAFFQSRYYNLLPILYTCIDMMKNSSLRYMTLLFNR